MLQGLVQNGMEYQEISERLHVYYLCSEYQNEFISACSSPMKHHILLERRNSKYFAVTVDATLQSSYHFS